MYMNNHDIKNSNYSSKSQASIGKSKLTPIITNFCELLQNNNYYVAIYASIYWFRERLILNDLTMCDKWIAQWIESVNFDDIYGMWQYFSTGRVNGIIGNVDLDCSYKDYLKIIKELGLNGYVKKIQLEVKEYTLTIYYFYSNGKKVSPTFVKKIIAGTSYNVNSPLIEEYDADKFNISGIINNDEFIIVTYTKKIQPTKLSILKKINYLFYKIFKFIKNIFKRMS